MPTARVDIILCVADRNDSRQISLLMNTCCECFSCPKFLMKTIILSREKQKVKKKKPGRFGVLVWNAEKLWIVQLTVDGLNPGVIS